MKSFVPLILLLLILAACTVNPEPIKFGKDACHACKMTLMDPKFGAELVSKKGRIYIFDDMNCLVQHIKSNNISEEDIAHLLVIDFANPENLTDAYQAFYLKSDAIKSPMASKIAAFSSATGRNMYAAEWVDATALSWHDIENLFE